MQVALIIHIYGVEARVDWLDRRISTMVYTGKHYSTSSLLLPLTINKQVLAWGVSINCVWINISLPTTTTTTTTGNTLEKVSVCFDPCTIIQLLNGDSEGHNYLYYVLRHSRHILGQDYHHSPSRLAQGFLVLFIWEVHQPHNNTATT